MLKIQVFAITAALFAASSCSKKAQQVESPHENPLGFWSDRTEISIFELGKTKSDSLFINSSAGRITGTWDGKQLRGVTDHQDSFELTIRGDTATYRILGLTLVYHRIPKIQYDSLSKVVP